MKDRRYPALFKLMAIGLLMASCQPEPLLPEGMLRVSTEPFAQQGKAVVDGTSSTWQDGDQIRFSNGTLATVSIVDGNYYISQSGIASGTSAVYPASTVNEVSGVWTLTLPETYHYTVDGSGHQVIDMPMAAYYNGDGTIYFKHLTGGLYFTVTNNTGATVQLDRVTVENETHYMNGSTLALTDISSSFLDGDRVFAGSGEDVARKRVSLLFNNGLELANGDSRQFLVPVPAFTVDAAFTVTVYAHNGTVSRYLFNQTQSVAHTSHITASQVGYANISLGDNVQATPFEGNGTYAKPYQIYTKEDYMRMVDSVNGPNATTYRNKYYDIAANIDMGGATVDGLRDFAGVIDGKGHTISNICFGNSDNGTILGMISTVLSDANDTIRSLTLDYVSFTSGGAKVGAFLGTADAGRPYVVLNNCHLGHITYNTLASGIVNVGGMIGYSNHYFSNGGSVTFNGCSVDQPITLNAAQTSSCTAINLGGLVGNSAFSTKYFNVVDCEIRADITIDAPSADLYVGGVAGCGSGSVTFTNVTIKTGTTFSISGKNNINAGSMVGSGSAYPCTFTNCTAHSITMNCTTNGNLGTGRSNLGGLLGTGESSNGKTFNNCSVSGSITLTKGNVDAYSYMGQVLGTGGNKVNWSNGIGNSALVTLTVTNPSSILGRDNIGSIYGNE